MHKYGSTLIVILAMCLLPSQVAAQEAGKIGVTMGFPESVGLIWHATEKMAVRPEFSFTTNSTDADFAESSNTTFSTGLSALFYLDRQDRFATYVSPRYAFRRSASEVEGRRGEEQESSSRTHLVSGSFGAQYWLGERFSLFGELGLAYLWGSAGDDDEDDEPTARSFDTRSAVGIVFYF